MTKKNILELLEHADNTFSSFSSLLRVLVQSRLYRSESVSNNLCPRCAIFSDNPSLSDEELKEISDEKGWSYCCVNNFAVFDMYTRIRPSSYVLLPHPSWGDCERDIKPQEIIKAIKDKTSWEMKLYVPFENSDIYSAVSENKDISICYYNRVIVKGYPWFRNLCYKLNLGMPSVESAVTAALILSINAGYRDISIVGAEHLWHEILRISPDNRLYFDNTGYCGTQMEAPVFIAEYRESNRMDDLLRKWADIFRGYWFVEEYARYMDTTICNMSRRSSIDAFERKKIG